jgi:hypothetical protein
MHSIESLLRSYHSVERDRNTVIRKEIASRRKKKQGETIEPEQRSLMNSADSLFTPAPKRQFHRKRKRHSLLRKRKSKQKR